MYNELYKRQSYVNTCVQKFKKKSSVLTVVTDKPIDGFAFIMMAL